MLLCIWGCVPSLHPLYTEADLTFAPELIGTWHDDQAQDTWQFSKKEKGYRLTHTGKEGPAGIFQVHLVKVGDHLFLDLYPTGDELELNSLVAFHLVPGHTFFHVRQITPTLEMRTINPEHFERFIEKHPDAIAHEIAEDDVIMLTAEPKELQAFLLDQLAKEEIFESFRILSKKANESL